MINLFAFRLLNILAQIDINEGEIDIPKTDVQQNNVQNVLQLVFGTLAAIAILIITISGLYFVLSRGNPEKSNRARNAIIYASIGLLVSVLASAIVRFVVGRVG